MYIRKKTGVLLAAVLLSVSAPLGALAADPDEVNDMIELLPKEKEDVTQENAKDIEKAMEAYEELDMADRLKVEDYKKLEKLYDAADHAGYITHRDDVIKEDEERAEQSQRGLEESESTETNDMKYVFNITSREKDMSIVVHYITDLNGDGTGDMPSRIVLTSPAGVTTPVSNSNTALKDETMDISLTWEDSFMQMDIAYADPGKWVISTSDPATFRKMPYAGIRKEIKAEDEKVKDDADKTDEEEEKDKKSFLSYLPIIALVGALIYLLKRYILVKPDDDKAKKEKKEEDIQEKIPRKMTDEEVAEQMRREYMEQNKEEEDDEDDYEPLEEDDITVRVDYDNVEIEEYEEGNTGILKEKDNPVLNGGGLREDGDGARKDKDEEEAGSGDLASLSDDFFGF